VINSAVWAWCLPYNQGVIQERLLDGSGLSLAIAAARFNAEVTIRLLEGAQKAISRYSVAHHDLFWVPGSFELPLAAKALAETRRYDAVVCLGAVIRHETDHYLHVATQAAAGIRRASLETGIPCVFGVLTCDTEEQAMARAGGRQGNKGADAVEAAIEMATLLRTIAEPAGE